MEYLVPVFPMQNVCPKCYDKALARTKFLICGESVHFPAKRPFVTQNGSKAEFCRGPFEKFAQILKHKFRHGWGSLYWESLCHILRAKAFALFLYYRVQGSGYALNDLSAKK